MTKLRVEAQLAEEEDTFDAYKLEHLYELMYKYGWYKLYSPSDAKFVEPTLKGLLNEGVEHLENTFIWWLKEHVLPGWWESRFEDLGTDPFVEVVAFLMSKDALNMEDVYDWVFTHVDREKMIYDAFNNDMQFFESYALPFLQEKFPDNEEIQENMNESDAISYIDVNALHEDFKDYLLNETGVFSAEEMAGMYSVPSINDRSNSVYDAIQAILLDNFIRGIIEENKEEFIQWTYQKFLDHFRLEPIIEDIQDALNYMQSVDKNSIEEMIAAFNKGLTTYHYSGQMSQHFADYLGGLGSNITQRLLDALSEGEYNRKWNYELKKEGIPVDAKKRVLNTFGN